MGSRFWTRAERRLLLLLLFDGVVGGFDINCFKRDINECREGGINNHNNYLVLQNRAKQQQQQERYCITVSTRQQEQQKYSVLCGVECSGVIFCAGTPKSKECSCPVVEGQVTRVVEGFSPWKELAFHHNASPSTITNNVSLVC